MLLKALGFALGARRGGTFCLLPWTSLNVNPDGRVLPCCVARHDLPVGDVSRSSLSSLWNGDAMRALRRRMLAGEPSAECASCYEREAAGFRTTRQWSLVRFAGALPAARSESAGEFKPKYLDLRLGNACNLSCRTCGPGLSTSWYEEAPLLGVQPPRGALDAGPAALEELRAALPHVEEIYFSGGEPTRSAGYRALLEELLRLGRFDVHLRYSTNFSGAEDGLLDLWDRFRSVTILASLDGMEARGEYLRKGLRWASVLSLRARLAERCPRAAFEVAAALSAMNALHLPDFHRRWAEEGRISLRGTKLTPVLDPAHYRAQILPAPLKDAVERRVSDHLAYIRRADPLDRFHPRSAGRRFASAVSFMRAEDRSALIPAFRAVTKALDRSRGEDFASVFPELAALLS